MKQAYITFLMIFTMGLPIIMGIINGKQKVIDAQAVALAKKDSTISQLRSQNQKDLANIQKRIDSIYLNLYMYGSCDR